jgi:aryl-alcohol dehydrogenase-like predicted oxidoreductase
MSWDAGVDLGATKIKTAVGDDLGRVTRRACRPTPEGPDGSAVSAAVVKVADDLDYTPTQVALAWLRERAAIPMLGATKPEHLEDDLGSLAVSPDDSVTERLEDASTVDLGFPMGFLSDPSTRGLLFEEVGDRIRGA